MPNSAEAMRRWFGLFFLALAFGLLIWGQTVLRDRLKGVSFLIYWGCCFFFTLAAIVTALIDVRATRKQSQKEHENLVQRTLDEMERKRESDDESQDKPGS